MSLLDDLIERLNRQVEKHNAKLDRLIDEGELTEDDARRFRVPDGSVTREVVREGPSAWSFALRRALRSILTVESPDEIIRMADAVTLKTETIVILRRGALKSVGAKNGPTKGMPVGVRLLDMAHLVAHSDAGKAVLLG